MRAKDIKVGQQYLARLDSHTERALVTVVDKSRKQTTRTCDRNGYPSVFVVIRTVFVVRDEAGRNKGTLSTDVQARDLFPVPPVQAQDVHKFELTTIAADGSVTLEIGLFVDDEG